MTYLGRFQLGQEVPLWLLSLIQGESPTLPLAAPVADIYSQSGLAVAQLALPVQEPPATTGLFQGSLYLDERFSPGRYSVVYSYSAAGVPRSALAVFEVTPGGDPSGQVLALSYYHTPQVDYLVQQRTSGRVFKGKNPRVA